MKVGLVTDCLGYMSFNEMVSTVSELGFQTIELGTGNWSSAPHLNLDQLLTNKSMRQAILTTLNEHNISICAFNCSGNPLAPNIEGKHHAETVEKTFRLAELMGVKEIVMMSGLPGGGPNETTANWITTSWPKCNMDILEWQWNEIAFPYWEKTVQQAKNCGIEKIALENHSTQLVYNPETLMALRKQIGDIIGMNLDPSHLIWMGGDPIRAIRYLGSAIYHVHAKDTRIERGLAEINGNLETKFFDRISERAWNYVALGNGHDVTWWKEFFSVLSMSGFDGNITLENEDLTMSPYSALIKARDVLMEALPFSA